MSNNRENRRERSNEGKSGRGSAEMPANNDFVFDYPYFRELNILDQSRLLSEYVRQRVIDLTQGALLYDRQLIGLVEEIAGFLQYIGEMYDLINKIHNMPINQRSSKETRDLFEAGYLALREKIYGVRNFGNGPIDRLNSLRTDTEVLSHQLRGFFRRFDVFLDGVVRHLQQEERVGVIELKDDEEIVFSPSPRQQIRIDELTEEVENLQIRIEEKQEEIEPLQVEYDRMKQTCVNQGKVIQEKMKELNEMHNLMKTTLQNANRQHEIEKDMLREKIAELSAALERERVIHYSAIKTLSKVAGPEKMEQFKCFINRKREAENDSKIEPPHKKLLMGKNQEPIPVTSENEKPKEKKISVEMVQKILETYQSMEIEEKEKGSSPSCKRSASNIDRSDSQPGSSCHDTRPSAKRRFEKEDVEPKEQTLSTKVYKLSRSFTLRLVEHSTCEQSMYFDYRLTQDDFRRIRCPKLKLLDKNTNNLRLTDYPRIPVDDLLLHLPSAMSIRFNLGTEFFYRTTSFDAVSVDGRLPHTIVSLDFLHRSVLNRRRSLKNPIESAVHWGKCKTVKLTKTIDATVSSKDRSAVFPFTAYIVDTYEFDQFRGMRLILGNDFLQQYLQSCTIDEQLIEHLIFVSRDDVGYKTSFEKKKGYFPKERDLQESKGKTEPEQRRPPRETSSSNEETD
ncbi:hypothetical protein ACFE04_020610 [Oxalis oulophora]